VTAGGTPAVNYKIRFDAPAIRYTEVRNNITQAVPQMTGSARFRVAAVSTFSSGYNDHTSFPSGGSIDYRVMCHVNQTDEPTTDTKFTLMGNS
jgi:hypothetical protein